AFPQKRSAEARLMRVWRNDVDRRVDAIALLTAANDHNADDAVAAILDVLDLEQSKQLAETLAYWLLEEMTRTATQRGLCDRCASEDVRRRLVAYALSYSRDARNPKSAAAPFSVPGRLAVPAKEVSE